METNQTGIYIELSALHEWDKNPRSIKPEDYERLKAQVQLLGQYKPSLVMPDGTVLGGNMRLKAYRELGIPKVWVSVIDFVQEGEVWYAIVNGEKKVKQFPSREDGMFEYALSDNDRSGYYDADMLANFMPNLNIDWSIYSADLKPPATLQTLLDQFAPKEEDDVPPLSADPAVSVLGEIYTLGTHRLMCGDATDQTQVEKLMNGQKADLIFTDPPYNVDYEGKTEDALKIKNDKFKSREEFISFLLSAFTSMNLYSKEGASIYVCHADSERYAFTKAFEDAGWHLGQVVIWAKQQFVMGRQDYQWQHEPILYGWKKGATHYFVDDRTQTTLWNIDRPSRSETHPTMKPVALVTKALTNNSKQGDIVLDVFGGSGSTLIASEQTKRSCYMMELDPKYCDVIRKRYAKLMDKEDQWQEITPKVQ